MNEENITPEEIETLDKLLNVPVWTDEDLIELGEIFDEEEWK